MAAALRSATRCSCRSLTSLPSLSHERYRASKIFHQIGSHPELRLIHEFPFIFTVPNFLSAAECAALRERAAGRLAPQTFDSDAYGARDSQGCVLDEPGLQAKLAALAAVGENQLQPLKVSRYAPEQRFTIHTDAWRAGPAEPGDWFNDRRRQRSGVPGAPIAGVNRIVTIFVYLSDVARGGRTRFRWTRYDECEGGTLGRDFYDAPAPGHGRTDLERGSGGDGVSIRPEEGLAVVHFPATTAESGGFTDYNAFHDAEPAVDEKWIAQQFIWSHPLEWSRVLDAENLLPPRE